MISKFSQYINLGDPIAVLGFIDSVLGSVDLYINSCLYILLPLMLCSSDMIFPRLNALSLWLVFNSLIIAGSIDLRILTIHFHINI